MNHINLSNKEANQLTRECIETALLLLLEHKSFESITITELTQKAGVSRPAFYRNYDSKEAILQHIAIPILEEIVALFQVPNCHHNPKHYLQFFDIIKTHQTKLRIYLSHIDKIPFSFFNENDETVSIEDYYYYRTGTMIYFSMAKDWLEKGCHPDSATMSRILHGMIRRLFP